MIGKICGTGSCVPRDVWDNQKLAQMVDTSDEWIRERTGVSRRHIAAGEENTVFLASAAARRALLDAGMDAGEVELILVATITPGRIMPCTACEVQREIGAENAVCFDLNGACTGFLFALNTAQAYIGQGVYRTALVIGAECLSNLVNWWDRSTCILFGDGAGAAVLRATEQGRYAQLAYSVGTGGEALTCASRNQIRYEGNLRAAETYLQMEGGAVFKFAVSKVPEAIRELLEREKLPKDQVKFYLLHQANRRIVEAAARRLGEKMEKFPINMAEYGNTSSASIPILLDEWNRGGKLCRGDWLVLAGFGAGLSYGASLMQW